MVTLSIEFIKSFLSLSVISISFIIKFPQIIRIYKSKSAKGISLFSLCLGICRLSIVGTYNYCHGYSILMYLECPLILFQDSILLYFVLKHNNLLKIDVILLSFLACFIIFMFMVGILPKIILEYIIVICPALNLISRFSQVFKIVQLKNAGAVSLNTWILTSYVAFARVCTHLMDSRDKLLLLNPVTGFLGSISIVFSTLYYQNKVKKSQ
ncbi:solute carrier family 66 member 3-like [Contarinia nasturtii]|uniref:solute carrier family 66 member 3-like n=1 Tax=Contarinia nasturtii TaxID=265458 RepID=UPI0012D3E309|nr:solute carrier family 66 member 3-like [Contarinia nasturtii]